jgi:hypothetical protein
VKLEFQLIIGSIGLEPQLVDKNGIEINVPTPISPNVKDVINLIFCIAIPQ